MFFTANIILVIIFNTTTDIQRKINTYNYRHPYIHTDTHPGRHTQVHRYAPKRHEIVLSGAGL